MTATNVVLTKGIVKPLKMFIKAGAAGFFIPFGWDSKKDKPELCGRNNWKYRLWMLKSVLVYSYYLYVLSRFIWLMKMGSSGSSQRIPMTMIFMFYLGGFFLEMPIILSHDLLAGHLCKLLEYFQTIQDEFYAEASPKPRKIILLEKIGKGMLWTAVIDACFMWVLSIRFPGTSPGAIEPVLTWMAPPGTFNGLVLTLEILAGVFQLYTLCNLVTIGFILVVTIVYNAMIVILLFENIRNPRVEGFGIFAVPSRRLYDATTILVRGLEEVYGFTLLWIQNQTMFMAMFSIYNAIRIGGALGILGGSTGMNCFALLVGMYHVLADFQRESQTATYRWVRSEHKTQPVWRKSLKARRVIRFAVAHTYFIDKTILLTMCKIVLDGSVNILILTEGRGRVDV